GHQAVAAGANANALGKNANAAFDGSTAVGFGATTNRANQVKLGGTGSSVTVGDLAASTLAQSGSVNVVTADGSGTLGAGPSVASLATAASVGMLNGQVNTINGQVGQLFSLNDINRADIRKANEGVAMALAMESPSLPTGANIAIPGGVGCYQTRTAATAAVSFRTGDMSSLSAGVGVGLNTGEVGARGGFQVAW
ncbi:hypothetical protein, partial [Polymorphobacter multimanifer]|uniref:hypothetical protein n=1 Tax=Polymorphobacter multimanifer TaxID=1070431 RepID=UPI001A9C5150